MKLHLEVTTCLQMCSRLAGGNRKIWKQSTKQPDQSARHHGTCCVHCCVGSRMKHSFFGSNVQATQTACGSGSGSGSGSDKKTERGQDSGSKESNRKDTVGKLMPVVCMYCLTCIH